MKTLSIITTAIAFALCSQSTFAHQNHSDKKKPVAAAAKEQKDWGIAGDAAKVTRTIAVSMSDKMRFTPDKIEIKQGETVRVGDCNAYRFALLDFDLVRRKTHLIGHRHCDCSRYLGGVSSNTPVLLLFCRGSNWLFLIAVILGGQTCFVNKAQMLWQ